MRALMLCALLSIGATASGCLHLFDWLPEGAAESKRYPEITKSQLWLHVKEAVHKHWRLKEIDEHEYSLQTSWEEHLGPMYQSGWRQQVNCWLYDSDQGPYYEVQVLRQVNMNIKNPISSSAADWDDRGRDTRQERRVLYEVDVNIRPPGATEGAARVGPKPSKYRYAMEENEEAARRRRLWDR